MTAKEEKCLASQHPVLFIAPNLRVLSLMREAIFNRFGLECKSITLDPTYNGFTYQVLSAISLSEDRLEDIRYYCEGFLDAIKRIGD